MGSAGRDASKAKGQGVRSASYSKARTAATKSAGTSDHRGHTKGKVKKTIATRKPRHWK